MKTSREEALLRGDLNLAAYMRHVNQHAHGAAREDADGLLLVAGPHPNPQPYVNAALRTAAVLSADDVITRASSFFGPRRRGYALWIRDHADGDLERAAVDAGFWQRPPLDGQPGVFIERVPDGGNAGREVSRITTVAEARGYLSLVGEVYGMTGSPDELIWALFLTPEAVLAPEVVAFAVWEGDLPVAGSMCFVSDDVGGMFWAVRSDRARGRGLGAACAAACVEGAFELGATLAAGQGSARGTPLWRALGWEVLTHYRRYVAPPPVR